MNEQIKQTEMTEEQKLQYDLQMARYLESVVREASFLPVTLTIGDIPVKQYSMRHHIMLDFANNPFVKGNDEWDKEHIWEFIWVVSTEFEYGNTEKKTVFLVKCMEKYQMEEQVGQLVMDILEYLNNAFLDNYEDTDNTGKSIPIVSWAANYIHAISSNYGWTDEYILDLPLNRVCQYVRCIDRDLAAKNGVEPNIQNRLSGRALKKWLAYLHNKSNGGVVMDGDKIVNIES